MSNTDEMLFVVYPELNGVITLVESYQEDEADDPKAFLTKAEAWAKATAQNPKSIVVIFEREQSKVFYSGENGPAEHDSRVGRVFVNSEGAIYRVKKSQKGYLKAQMFNIDMWVDAWGYSTSTWRELTAEEAAAFGHATHHCVFCYKSLTTEESTTVGYGPVCAEKNGLPWG